MANLKCVRHDRRVMVIDRGEIVAGLHAISVIHRDSGKRNNVCDSNALTIDGEFFSPREVIEFQNDPANSNDFVQVDDSELLNA